MARLLTPISEFWDDSMLSLALKIDLSDLCGAEKAALVPGAILDFGGDRVRVVAFKDDILEVERMN